MRTGQVLTLTGAGGLLLSSALPYYSARAGRLFDQTYYGAELYGIPVIAAVIALGLLWYSESSRIASVIIAVAGLGAAGFCANLLRQAGRETVSTDATFFNIEQGTQRSITLFQTEAVIEPHAGVYIGLVGGVILLIGGITLFLSSDNSASQEARKV